MIVYKNILLTFRLPGFEHLNGPLKVAKKLSCITYQLYRKFMSEVEPIYRLSGSLKVNKSLNVQLKLKFLTIT